VSARGGAISSARAVRLIARRELQARLLSKAFLVSLGVTIAIVFGAFGISALLGGGDPVRIGLVGAQPAQAATNVEAIADLQGIDVELVDLDSREAAEAAIDAGDVDAAIIDGTELVMNEIDDAVVALVTPAWQQAALVEGMAAAGLDDDGIEGALAAAAPLEIVELDADPDSGAKQVVAFASVILLFVSIQIAGAYIMMGVFEEKSTKVVELVLSSVRARELLAGKIVGVGVIGVVQVVALAGSALIAASLFGSGALPVLSFALIGTAIVWFLLGYLLYGAIFAAGASLAPRQEDAQSTLGPISVVLMLSYFAAIFSASDPESAAARIISWLPITAPFTMPGRMASGDALWWEVVGAMALTAAAATVVLLLAERIYVRSVIHTDRKLGWREAWSMRT
jgi:ABC-2 type transport system permease protein